jgi:uncharacterized membrane protein YcaP (DUF421 family)
MPAVLICFVMDKSDIRLSDINRILFGNAPVSFMAEVFIRTVIVYVFLIIIVRLMGKRLSGQITITELAIMIMLGAIVAPAMEMPERGLLQGMFTLVLIWLYQQFISWWGIKNAHVEKLTQGDVSVFVKDGVLQLAEIKKARISHDQLFAVLRSKHVFNLGKVKRLYMEASGMFSLYTSEQPKPGLSLLPELDDGSHQHQQKAEQNLAACIHCGNTVPAEAAGTCAVCGNQQWDKAVLN